ncbi:MAG: sterol desaturase family protein [Sandaracinaceae bacterium]|nr:sterol desaturase family protein [Sandaracinaceae bacterium]
MTLRLTILSIGLTFGLLELWRSPPRGRSGRQLAFDLLSSAAVGLVVSPLVALTVSALLDVASPSSRNALADLPLWAAVGLFLVGDDLTQYLWHRASHSVPFLYTLHRAHHSARYMSVSMMYRNNVFYYALMPSLWVSGALVHAGLGAVYAGYLAVKLTVIAGAHSSVRWDERLYRVRWLSHVMWVVERIVSTPSTHAMHHGRHADDGVTHYAGNYGNLLFFWDVLFGTARITRRYPEAYGIENLAPESATTELLWPLVPLRGEGRAAEATTTLPDAAE